MLVRALAATHGDLAKRLAELKDKTDALAVFDALREPMAPPDPPKRPIGFMTPQDTGKKTSVAKSKK